MFARLALSAVVFLALAIGAVMAWQALKEQDDRQIVLLLEVESYSARSHLARGLEALVDDLKNLQSLWSTLSNLTDEQWELDDSRVADLLQRASLITWFSPDTDQRYMMSREHPVLDHSPDDREWALHAPLVDRAMERTGNELLGPFQNGRGEYEFEIHLADHSDPGEGRLAAIIPAERLFHTLLVDQSPDYAITVSWGDTLLYRRGEPATGIPESWAVGGKITSSLGGIWTVSHAPAEPVVRAMTSMASDLILLLGLVIAVLGAVLTYEYSRARGRAVRAEHLGRELGELNRVLEDLVAERTRELEQRTRDLQTIADSVGHDLRNPLSAATMNTHLLKQLCDGQLGDRERRVLERIPVSLKQMNDILDRLLGISVLAHGTFEREEVDMRQLVEETFESLAAGEPPPAVRLFLADLPNAAADRLLVGTLITNLLGNAIKYTREKPSREIHVDFQQRDGETVYRIRDNGIGFDREAAERLFQAFHRQSESTGIEGTGLGLTIASRVVQRHGGRIWAEGEPGEGAVFNFTLAPPENQDSDGLRHTS